MDFYEEGKIEVRIHHRLLGNLPFEYRSSDTFCTVFWEIVILVFINENIAAF